MKEGQKEEDEGEEKEATEVTSMSVNGQEEEEEEEVLYSVGTLENEHLLEESAKH
ncbi:MAG: hypothetical protein MPL62_11685 [Alphaproteobacteria bacterium]|nr:hypothetical protein [Alphaproteobacteria bacterium]